MAEEAGKMSAWECQHFQMGGATAMGKRRDTYKYDYKIGNKTVHSGITDDLERREEEHQQKWPGGHIKQVGIR